MQSINQDDLFLVLEHRTYSKEINVMEPDNLNMGGMRGMGGMDGMGDMGDMGDMRDMRDINNYLDTAKLGETSNLLHDEYDWTYERLRDHLGEFNNGFYEYADRLSSHVRANYKYKPKFLACRDRVNEKEVEKRNNIQDKISLQEALDDLQAKYDALAQALEKVEDINEDNKEIITRLRAHRDRCVQNHANRKKTIDSLRDEATELRRQITHARSQAGN